MPRPMSCWCSVLLVLAGYEQVATEPARPEATPAAVVTEVSAPDGGPSGAGAPIDPR
ncbi:hypothetical protein [Streptomyces noursei]|uniref:hypothetical protein n=1 Tax=Streptomyces noursei TaxID=1971 RepID=UPI0013520DE9